MVADDSTGGEAPGVSTPEVFRVQEPLPPGWCKKRGGRSDESKGAQQSVGLQPSVPDTGDLVQTLIVSFR